MADLVLDEWLWADLGGDNGPLLQVESFEFLHKVWEKCDRHVVVEGSSFDRKFWALANHSDIRRREIVKFYRSVFRYNWNKTLILENDQLPDVPEMLAKETKYEDHYIIQACLATPDSRIITTDRPLKDSLLKHGVSCEHRDEFVRAYLS